jgi:hypothetical protein
MEKQNPMKVKPNDECARTVKTQKEFLIGLILEIAAAFRVELATETQVVYLTQLARFPPEKLRAAADRVICEWDKPSIMPTLKFILDRIENHQLAAEQAWEFLQRVIRRHWHPDIGFYSDAPKLDEATEYAVRQAGGLTRIHDASDKTLSFIRNEFLTSHQRFQQEGGEQTRMSQSLAVSTLKQLQRARPALPERAEALEKAADAITDAAEVSKPFTPADHEARMKLLHNQAEKLKGKSA